MALSRREVEEIAALARLALGEDELARLTRQLGDILGYVEELATVDVTSVEPTSHAVPLDCPLREDTLGDRLATEEALAQAPRRHDGFFEVPRIIDSGRAIALPSIPANAIDTPGGGEGR
jgi:aspartyl-tRNA(Asn)/glutamyl-tRNA(Gln) amidotransferase subunit C